MSRRSRVLRVLVPFAASAALAGTPFPTASAEEADGGTESVFANGAGNRALALGGAFTAVADDATAPAWNPAGLARLERQEFVASHASLYGLDVTEQHASLAWPSWRWGTGAVSVRRIGVDAIERRDPRNQRLDDFNNSDLEVALAYGRKVGAAWHLGATAKMHRQSIAGFSDMGIGLDLGVLVEPGLALGREGSWARRLTMGLAVLNAVPPTIRLDRADVADPVSLRVGTAYRTPLLSQGWILAAADLEKAADTAVDPHFGLEIAPHPLLALRAGWNGDHFTAGTGLSWNLYRFDYVYEDNPIDPVHRFGVSIAFGATTAEAHAAARDADEESFRRRLEASFDRRRDERVTELLAHGRELLEDDRLDEVGPVVETIRALAPDDRRVASLEADLFARRAGTAEGAEEFTQAAILWSRVLAVHPDDLEAAAGRDRCRLESDRRAERTARIRELFATALDAFAAGDFPAARTHLEEILQLAPGDTEAQDMLARTESALASRVSSLLEQASRALDRGDTIAAADALTEARSLDPTAGGLAALESRRDRIERDRRLAATAARVKRVVAPTPATDAPAPAVKPPALSRKKQRELADLYRNGMEAMREERPDDALRYWELVWMADPGYQNVAEFLKREYLLRGLESFSRGGLDEAIRLWEKARDVDPADEKTLGYLSRAREQLSRSNEILGEEQ